MKRFLPVIFGVCLTAQFVFGLGGESGAILCIGTDGHAGFETGDAYCCEVPPIATRESSPETPKWIALAAPGECGPCADIPVLRAETPRVSRVNLTRIEHHRCQLDCTACIALAPTETVPGLNDLILPAPVPPASMPSLRSTVLQI